MPQPAWGSASPGDPGGQHALTCTGTQFSGGQSASTCLRIWSLEGCHTSTYLGIHQTRGSRGWHASACPGTQFSGGQPASTCPGFNLQKAVTAQCTWGSAPWPRDVQLSGCNSTGWDKLQKDSPLRKFTNKIEGGLLVFFLFLPINTVFQMGNNQSTSWQMPIRYILDKRKMFDFQL